MKESAAWYWSPANSLMRAAGVEDNKREALQFMARLSRPRVYGPDGERFGMPERSVKQ